MFNCIDSSTLIINTTKMDLSDQERDQISNMFSEIGFKDDDERVNFLNRNTFSYPYFPQEHVVTQVNYQLNTEIICPIGTK